MSAPHARTAAKDLPTAPEFDEMVQPHLSRLFAAGRRLTGNESDAEDLLQDTLFRAFRNREKFQLGTNLAAWLLKIQTNLFLNAVRQRKSRPPLVDIDIAEAFYREARNVDSPSSPRHLPLEECLDDEVIAALGDLPEDFRTVVSLAVFESFTYAEIAETVGCPIGTVMSRLYRGRRLLREKLSAYAQRSGIRTES